MASDHPQLNGKEPGKHPLRAMHGFAHEKNHDPQLGLNDFVGGSTAAATQLRGGLPPHVVRRVRDTSTAASTGGSRSRVSQIWPISRLCYFVRAFKQSVGVTPRGYLTRRRLKRTMELLSGSDMSISEIALAAGFADQSHCARRFRQHLGLSPRDYRRAST